MRRIALALLVVAVMPACDQPSRPSPESSPSPGPDFVFRVTPTAWNNAEVSQNFSYTFAPLDYYLGDGSIEITGLGPDLELVGSPPAIGPLVNEDAVHGSFQLRRRDPLVNAAARVTVTAAGGGHTHQQVIDVALVGPLELSCFRTPASGPPPLTVTFIARGNRCVGGCAISWDFGDVSRAEGGDQQHVYAAAGDYTAVATVTDGVQRSHTTTCTKSIVVSTPAPPEPPPPTPPSANSPPSISPPVVTYPNYGHASITAVISDTDPGDTVTWQVEVIASPAGSSFQLMAASGSGPNVSTQFESVWHGSFTVRIHARDAQGAQAQRDVVLVIQ
jgi:hypothetical protein